MTRIDKAVANIRKAGKVTVAKAGIKAVLKTEVFDCPFLQNWDGLDPCILVCKVIYVRMGVTNYFCPQRYYTETHVLRKAKELLEALNGK